MPPRECAGSFVGRRTVSRILSVLLTALVLAVVGQGSSPAAVTALTGAAQQNTAPAPPPGFYGSTGSLHLAAPIVGMAPTPTGAGYWLVAADGGIFSFGDAAFRGSTGSLHLAAPIVGMAPTPTGAGYWLVAADGGIFSFGDAAFRGSTGSLHLAAPIVGMAPTPTGAGYWLVAADGGIFSFGDAAFRGSTGSLHLAAPIVGMAPTPTGAGYWLVAADGGIFSFGDAAFRGSTGSLHLAAPIVGMAPTPTGAGYWLVAADGGIFSFGDAAFRGSTGSLHLAAPIVGMAPTPTGAGYWLVAADGGVFVPGLGSSSSHPNAPATGAAAPGAGAVSVPPPPVPPGPTVSVPDAIASDCSADVTGALQSWLGGVPDGAVVSFAPNACYRADGVITFYGHHDITLKGNGATLQRVLPQTNIGWLPQLQLYQDTLLTITNLTIKGTLYNGTDAGGSGEEGHYGIVLAGDHGIRFDHISIDHVSGDFMNFFPPGLHGDDPKDKSLNSDVLVTNSTFNGAGYHGITIESAQRVTFSNDTFSTIVLDGIDLEYDSYGTVFAPDGTPQVAGEIDITFDHTTWTNFNQEWFVSWQGAVVTQNIRLTNNHIHNDRPGFWVDIGSMTDQDQTLYDGFVITGNVSDIGLAGAPYTDAFNFTNVKNVLIADNTVPLDPAENKWAGQFYAVQNVVIRNNQFPDASSSGEVDPISKYTGQPWPGPPSKGVVKCQNTFGPGGSLHDGPCPAG